MSDDDDASEPWPEWSKNKQVNQESQAPDYDWGLVFKVLLVLGGFGGALVIWAIQIFFYLRTATWKSFSVLDALIFVDNPEIKRWVLFPTDWLGVHAVLSYLPVSVVLLAFGVLVLSASGEDY